MNQLFGLLGEKLNYSYSPKIHSLIMEKLQMKGCYHLFEVGREQLEDAICGMKVLGLRGVNVTIPYKVEVMKFLHGISQEAESIGAINTISFEGGRTIGYNTDYYGLKRMLSHYNIPIKDQRVLILGTGGAAKAVIQLFLNGQAKDITIVSRYKRTAQEVYQDHRVLSYGEIKNNHHGEIIINCTPLGMHPYVAESPVSREVISDYHWAVDLNYNPIQTTFLRYAQEAGIQGVNGLYMLVAQAVKSQEIWNDIEIPDSIVLDIYQGLIEDIKQQKS